MAMSFGPTLKLYSMHALQKRAMSGVVGETGCCLVVGLNSGTSMDGVDAVLVEISEGEKDVAGLKKQSTVVSESAR